MRPNCRLAAIRSRPELVDLFGPAHMRGQLKGRVMLSMTAREALQGGSIDHVTTCSLSEKVF
jgi:hypothetical protein